MPSSPATRALLQALFVTFLWSTSWVLIKIGLDEVPPLTYAGLRYGLATLVLLPFVLRGGRGAQMAAWPRVTWLRLAILGLVMIAVTQGAQFVALSYLKAQTTTLVLSFTPVLVALLGAVALGERLVGRQVLGIALYLVGAVTFFYPAGLAGAPAIGLAVAGLGLASNAGASVLGRQVNRTASIDPLLVTLVSMGVGGSLLLATGLAVEGWPTLSGRAWAMIVWLAVVNTAFAFTLWNASLRHLSAVASSVVNNTMLIQIAVLAWLFLGEPLGAREIVGLALAAVGALVVQVGPSAIAAWRTRAGAPR